MNYTPFNETNSTKYRAHEINRRDSEFENIHVDEEDMKHMREEMFEYYKKNKNLSYYYYMYDDPNWQKDIEDLTREFYAILSDNKEKKEIEDEEKYEEPANIQMLKNTPTQRTKNRKYTENFIRKPSDNTMMKEKKVKNTFDKTCLDLDDLVNVELPTEYNPEKHEDLMMGLGEELMISRKVFMSYMREKRAEYLMKNEDFSLLLCLMRKKKEAVYEKNPYYVDYNVKLGDVYRNEKSDLSGGKVENENDVDIESFVRKYIDNEN